MIYHSTPYIFVKGWSGWKADTLIKKSSFACCCYAYWHPASHKFPTTTTSVCWKQNLFFLPPLENQLSFFGITHNFFRCVLLDASATRRELFFFALSSRFFSAISAAKNNHLTNMNRINTHIFPLPRLFFTPKHSLNAPIIFFVLVGKLVGSWGGQLKTH